MQIMNKTGLSDVEIKELFDYFDIPRLDPFKQRTEELLASEKSKKGTMIKIYLENFKTFNDTFGFQFGGLFIKEIARFLCSLKGADVYRVAGVEFVAVFDEVTRSTASELANEIIDRFERSWCINNMDCMCSVNVGVACYPGSANNADEMLMNLSQTVSASANVGPNTVTFYNEELQEKIYRRNMIAKQIPKALEDGAIEIRYRPSHHVALGRFTRAECYLRMISKEFGIVPASEFIPIAEESGQIYAISQYTVKRVCALIADFLKDGIDFETIAIPVSPIQFLQERFVHDVSKAISEAGIPPEKLAFEVTESVAITAFSQAQISMNEFSEMGIEIMLTDFGTGYSGINNILLLPVDVLKIERMLIWQLDNGQRSAKLVE